MARERALGTHPALVAQIEYLVALTDAMSGRWGDALATATSSRNSFERLGERANAGTSEMLMGDLLAYLGQPRLAWRHHLRAAAAFSAAGEWDQLQVCAATMNQVELRRHRWSTAHAISQLELALGADPVLLADAHVRSASAAIRAGDAAAARLSLRAGTAVAASIGDADLREKLLADLAGVEGRLLAGSDPRASIARLSVSIDFQERVGRAFALPELYLDRGRVHAAQGHTVAALSDFEAGISSLEAQRSRVREFELRAGFFDDARALFGEAVSATLRRGAVEQAFAYLERGRARALLDELPDGPEVPHGATIAAIRRDLAPGTLLLSYAVLPAGVAIFLIDRDQVTVRYSNATAKELAAMAEELIRDLRERRDASPAAVKLYDALLLPADPELRRATRLVVISDAAFGELPFAALYDRRKNAFVAETHELLMEPSAAVYVACLRRARSLAPPGDTIAIFANPTVAAPETYPFLVAADREAPLIARRYARSLLLRRDSATAERFLAEAPNYGVIQFSGHAHTDDTEPWKSSLIFNSALRAHGIAKMRFSCTSVVVLGACSTLAFDREHVEGTSAIARSFLAAGVPMVIGSLWDVDDAAAAVLMVRLHDRLSRGVPAVTAMRDAQMDLIHDPWHRYPGAVWAAFTVLGADRLAPR